jgi:hypothetical protein
MYKTTVIKSQMKQKTGAFVSVLLKEARGRIKYGKATGG